MDVQGGEAARPYVEQSGARFTTVVDEENHLGQLYGFRAIPNGFLIDENGILRYKKLSGFDIRKPEHEAISARWAEGSNLEDALDAMEAAVGPEHTESNRLFLKGIELYRSGKVAEAVEVWRQGVALAPDNLIIRKQIWAVENPEKFYAGDVDYTWQREQMEKGL